MRRIRDLLQEWDHTIVWEERSETVLEGRVRGWKKESPASPTEALTWLDMSDDIPGKSEKPSTCSCQNRAMEEEHMERPRADCGPVQLCGATAKHRGELGTTVGQQGQSWGDDPEAEQKRARTCRDPPNTTASAPHHAWPHTLCDYVCCFASIFQISCKFLLWQTLTLNHVVTSIIEVVQSSIWYHLSMSCNQCLDLSLKEDIENVP